MNAGSMMRWLRWGRAPLARLEDLAGYDTPEGAEALAFLHHQPHCTLCREGRLTECPDGRDALSLLRG